jgi:hypothetical protein
MLITSSCAPTAPPALARACEVEPLAREQVRAAADAAVVDVDRAAAQRVRELEAGRVVAAAAAPVQPTTK